MDSFLQRTWIAIVIAAGVACGLWLFASLFHGCLILFAGALLGVFLSHLSDTVTKTVSLRYRSAFAVVVILMVILTVAIVYLMGSQIVDRVDQFVRELENSRSYLVSEVGGRDWWKSIFGQNDNGQSLAVPQGVLTSATSALTTSVAVVGGTVLVLFLGFYFALQPQLYRQGILSLVPERFRQGAGHALMKSSQELWCWMLGRFVGMTAIGVCTALGLWMIGIPLPFTLGVLAALLTFVPNVGPLVSAMPPMLFALQIGGYMPLYVALLYLALQFLESYFLTPLITQHQVSLPPGLTLSCQLLFGMLAGVLGLLLATPITVVLHVLVRELYGKACNNEGA